MRFELVSSGMQAGIGWLLQDAPAEGGDIIRLVSSWVRLKLLHDACLACVPGDVADLHPSTAGTWGWAHGPACLLATWRGSGGEVDGMGMGMPCGCPPGPRQMGCSVGGGGVKGVAVLPC